jgi:cell division protein ZapA (FtsZ GTPase activity inhibitor)
MDAEEIKRYVEGLEKKVEVTGNENAGLVITLNKVMMENLKLKADIRQLEQKLAQLEIPKSEKTIKLE